jgi:hypothetical protein
VSERTSQLDRERLKRTPHVLRRNRLASAQSLGYRGLPTRAPRGNVAVEGEDRRIEGCLQPDCQHGDYRPSPNDAAGQGVVGCG